MDLLLWSTVAFFVTGLVVLLAFLKSVRTRVIYLKNYPDADQSAAKPVIRYIWTTTIWGVISIGLVVSCFAVYA